MIFQKNARWPGARAAMLALACVTVGPTACVQPEARLLHISIAVELPNGPPRRPHDTGANMGVSSRVDDPMDEGQGEIADNQGPDGVHTMIPAGTPSSLRDHKKKVCVRFPVVPTPIKMLTIGAPQMSAQASLLALREARRAIALSETILDRLNSNMMATNPCLMTEVIEVDLAIPAGSSSPGPDGEFGLKSSGTPSCPSWAAGSPCIWIPYYDLDWETQGGNGPPKDQVAAAQEKAFAAANEVLALEGRILVNGIYH